MVLLDALGWAFVAVLIVVCSSLLFYLTTYVHSEWAQDRRRKKANRIRETR